MSGPRYGESVLLGSRSFNRLDQGARLAINAVRHGAVGRFATPYQPGVVLVRNVSGATRGRFDVLGIDGPVIDPQDSLLAFQNRIALRGVVPTAGHVGRFVVLLEPLADGAIGRACVDGLCVVLAEVQSADVQLVDCIEGQAGKLVGNPSGTARLLWIAPPTSGYPYTGWAVVQLGCGGTGAAILWAQITSITGNQVFAKFADAAGHVDPEAEAFRVYVYASDVTGVTWSPELDECNPHLMEGQYIQIVQMPACGPARPAGWWMIGPPLSLLCEWPNGEEEDEGLGWLLAHVGQLRALLSEAGYASD